LNKAEEGLEGACKAFGEIWAKEHG
jgi:hypothetical protein